jgi:hypothetical protein
VNLYHKNTSLYTPTFNFTGRETIELPPGLGIHGIPLPEAFLLKPDRLLEKLQI